MNNKQQEGPGGKRFFEMVLNGKALAVPEEAVAMICAIPGKRKKKIIKENRVCFKDVIPFLAKPGQLLQGPLSTLKGSFLRKLHLPVIIPAGGGLPEYSDELASVMVVVYDGWWSGVLLCSEAGPMPVPLSSYEKGASGDITGRGGRADGRGSCLVVDVRKLLRREGFLVAN